MHTPDFSRQGELGEPPVDAQQEPDLETERDDVPGGDGGCCDRGGGPVEDQSCDRRRHYQAGQVDGPKDRVHVG